MTEQPQVIPDVRQSFKAQVEIVDAGELQPINGNHGTLVCKMASGLGSEQLNVVPEEVEDEELSLPESSGASSDASVLDSQEGQVEPP